MAEDDVHVIWQGHEVASSEGDVVHWVSPEWLREIIREPVEAASEHHDSLDSSSGDDSHEKVGDYACNNHHQALNQHYGDKQEHSEVEEANKVVSDRSWDEGVDDQERDGGERVPYHICSNSVMPIQSFSVEDLQILSWLPAFDFSSRTFRINVELELTFRSSTKEGKPPMAISVNREATNDSIAALACR
ncbi:hypothetical protein AKJ16_DCAP05733 [Drosera capensis]